MSAESDEPATRAVEIDQIARLRRAAKERRDMRDVQHACFGTSCAASVAADMLVSVKSMATSARSENAPVDAGIATTLL